MPNRILLVDDNSDLLASMGQALADEGFKVVPAVDGQQALDYLITTKPPPACVVVDVNLPVMSGDDFLTIIRGYLSFRALPVVVISGERSVDVTGYPPACFLPKPFTIEQLVAAIKSVLPPQQAGTN